MVDASPLTAEPAARSAQIICLAWGAHFLTSAAGTRWPIR